MIQQQQQQQQHGQQQQQHQQQQKMGHCGHGDVAGDACVRQQCEAKRRLTGRASDGVGGRNVLLLRDCAMPGRML